MGFLQKQRSGSTPANWRESLVVAWDDRVNPSPEPTVSNVLAKIGNNRGPLILLEVPAERRAGVLDMVMKFSTLSMLTGFPPSRLADEFYSSYRGPQQLGATSEAVMAYSRGFLGLCFDSVRRVTWPLLDAYSGPKQDKKAFVEVSKAGLEAARATVRAHHHIARILHPGSVGHILVSPRVLYQTAQVMDRAFPFFPDDMSGAYEEINAGLELLTDKVAA